MTNNLTTQRGAALISALVLMAVAASVALWCYAQQHVWLRQAQAMLRAERATAVLEDARAWALQTVAKPMTTRQPLRYQRQQAGFEVSASVVSEGGRYNLNEMQSPSDILHFVFLLQTVDKQLSTDRAVRLAYDLNAWMSPASRLERYYLNLTPPHRQAHRAMVQWSELRAVRGVSAALYRQLVSGPERYVTALPTQNFQFDVNFVSAPVLASVTSLSFEEAQRVVRCRDASPWMQSPEELLSRCGRGLQIEMKPLNAQSRFFLFQARAQQGDSQQMLTCLLERVETNRGWTVKIVWQEWNDV